MHRRAALIAIFLIGAATPAKSADWWWIGLSGNPPNRVVTYLDMETVVRLKGGGVQAWTLGIGEAPLPNGQQHQATQYVLKCKARTHATLSRAAYDSSGSRLPLSNIKPSKFAPVLRGSIGESILNLACGNPSGMELQVASPVQHAVTYLASQGTSSIGGAAPTPKSEKQTSLGTGFFVSSTGTALTSYHVIEGAQRIGCRTSDGELHSATLLRVSAANDLALLQVRTRPISYLSLAPHGSVRSGDRVFTVGYGAVNYLGINEPRFTEGTISALSGLGAEDAYMQISVPVQPGNSGGPLINESGEVVGIIAAEAAIDAFLKAEGTLPQSINWAVKSDYAAPLIALRQVARKLTRVEAIEAARQSLCLIVAEG